MLGSVTFSIVFEDAGWSLQRDGLALARFDSIATAERRGRWLTARAAVQGLESRLEVHDRFGHVLGVWRNETFESAPAVVPLLAA